MSMDVVKWTAGQLSTEIGEQRELFAKYFPHIDTDGYVFHHNKVDVERDGNGKEWAVMRQRENPLPSLDLDLEGTASTVAILSSPESTFDRSFGFNKRPLGQKYGDGWRQELEGGASIEVGEVMAAGSAFAD